MRNCIEYVLRQDKTNELFTCVTGPYCHDEINYDLVYRTFLEEKKVWDKDSGRMYAHNIISWHKDEQITPCLLYTSTRQVKPDLAAPGVDIITAKAGGGYEAVTGTSFAAPFVTGSAALLKMCIRDRYKRRMI